MATSLAMIILFGLLSKKLFEKMKLPGLLGMIIVGISIGPYGLDLLSQEILMSSADLRKIALIIILLRAGLGIKKEDITSVGRPAINMGFIPGVFEGFAVALASMFLFEFTFVQGGILGFIIAAVSPAVIVPSMLDLMERGLGAKKNVPTLILAGASMDDVFAITIFTAFLGAYAGEKINIFFQLGSIVLSIALGILLGILLAAILIRVFEKYRINDSKKLLYLLSSAILLTTLEDVLKARIDIASLLGVMAVGFLIFEEIPKTGKILSSKLNKIWVFAELLLFVLVGAEVNLVLALAAGFKGLALLLFGLIFRSLGVMLSLTGSHLNLKERLFCILAYIPKATVQAAIGAIPLSMGVESGDLMLSLAVLAIIVTAPLGAIAIKLSADRLLL